MLLSLLTQRRAQGALQLRALKYSAGVTSDNDPYFHMNNLLKSQKWFFWSMSLVKQHAEGNYPINTRSSIRTQSTTLHPSLHQVTNSGVKGIY